MLLIWNKICHCEWREASQTIRKASRGPWLYVYWFKGLEIQARERKYITAITFHPIVRYTILVILRCQNPPQKNKLTDFYWESYQTWIVLKSCENTLSKFPLSNSYITYLMFPNNNMPQLQCYDNQTLWK